MASLEEDNVGGDDTFVDTVDDRGEKIGDDDTRGAFFGFGGGGGR